LYHSDLVLVADWSISCRTKAGVFTSSHEGKLSDVLAPVLVILSFKSVAWDGVVVGTMGSLILSCPLILSGTQEFAFICWRLGLEVLSILCFSVSSREFVLFVASCRAIVSFNSDSWSIF